MDEVRTWYDERKRIQSDIAREVSSKTSISEERFREVYLDENEPRSIGDFNKKYLPDERTLGEIFAGLSKATGLAEKKIESHYDAGESFAQFGEHLLRSGAYVG